jgi:hypothetical protein
MPQYKSEMDGYDGFIFLPNGEDGDGQEFRYIKYKDDFGPPIEGNEVGAKYHVAFFKRLEDGEFDFDETFEAIFSDPVVYAKGLCGTGTFGTIIRKQEKTSEWFKEYLTDLIFSVKILKSKP